MKKAFAVLLSAVMLVGCSSSTTATATATPAASAEATTETAAGSVKVGIGSTTGINASDATADKDGSIQVNTTVAAVAVNADGTIAWVKFDVAQNSGKFDTKGVITSEDTGSYPTKVEKGADYGMAGTSPIKKEWFEQVAALETYSVGKTVDEVINMATVTNDEGKIIADVEDLKTSCTIGIGDLLSALSAANDNAVEVTGAATYGMGISTSMSFKDATADKEGSVQSNVTYDVTAMDADGKIVYTYLDVAQNSGKFDAAGAVTASDAAKTKKAKGTEYGMAGTSPIKKEWDEQAAAFEAYVVGMTADDVKNIAVTANDEGSNTVNDLTTSCTIGADSFMAAVESAMASASK